MLQEYEERLWSAGSDQTNDLATWRHIVNDLLDDFGRFIGDDFVRDDEIDIDPVTSSFRTWIWSKPTPVSPLGQIWSAVLAGCPIGDPQQKDSFGVSITLFLFHGESRKRLYSNDGLQFLLFLFRRELDFGSWQSRGWQRDEWGEWENLVFEGAPQST
jgi:hypothetical protein